MAVSAGCSDTGYEADELRLPDPEVLFLRQEPVPAGRVEVLNAEGIGELVLDGPCLQLRGDATIVWPAGSALHVDDGVVEVRDRAGQVRRWTARYSAGFTLIPSEPAEGPLPEGGGILQSSLIRREARFSSPRSVTR